MEDKGILEVFNVDVENVNLEEDVKKESVYFKPRQDGNEAYTALIRFLPIPTKEDGNITGFEKKPYYMKKRYWLKDDAGNGNYYDSATSVNERCPIQTTFFRLYNSDDIKEKKAAKEFNLSTHYWSLVYILDDKQNPDLVGKTLIWRYTNDVKKLIEKELNPVVSEYQKKAKDKVAVWDLIKGKNLALVVGQAKVTLDGKDRVFPNYDASEFLEATPLEVNGVELDTKNVELITELFNSVPDEISALKYEPWNDDTKKAVNKILARYNITPAEETEAEETETDESNTTSGDEADKILENLNL